MVTDHTDEPGAYAARQAQNLNVPNAAVFDTAYMQHMVQDHQKDVAEFQKQTQSGSDEILSRAVSAGVAAASQDGSLDRFKG